MLDDFTPIDLEKLEVVELSYHYVMLNVEHISPEGPVGALASWVRQYRKVRKTCND